MAYNFERLNVLLVEDDQSMRVLIRDMLFVFGIQNVATATDGSRAYAELRHFPADFVLTDWAMEPLDGIEFTKMVRTAADSPNPFVPIIMLTAHTQRSRIIEARDSGVTEFLAKPMTSNALYSRIVGIIETPRPFVRASSYFGPDRRRSIQEFMGQNRRGADD
ncbi:MAG: response regulator [Rhodospirillaceae bacterium]|jgi:DNA-binding response OmpR family regulator|nr:response regulator [Rhodospirillaceae bacterium]MBT5665105.1 response regulator [Rhodospirillaceae bacterium]MBT5810905.1 response regulator [Rhodospirillaceae bacterium]